MGRARGACRRARNVLSLHVDRGYAGARAGEHSLRHPFQVRASTVCPLSLTPETQNVLSPKAVGYLRR